MKHEEDDSTGIESERHRSIGRDNGHIGELDTAGWDGMGWNGMGWETSRIESLQHRIG